MRYPQIISDEITHEGVSDWIITFRFDGDLLPDSITEIEFDRNQYQEGPPPESIYEGLPEPLAKLIEMCFGFPRIDPHRHARVTQREVTLTLDPSPWNLDIDPVSHFTWHYRKLCGQRVRS